MEYIVKIEQNGSLISVGTITDRGFQYMESYLKQPEARGISISLPLQKEYFSPERTKCFFDGLLPEGFSRRAVAEWIHVSEEDYISILAALGKECLGAIQISGPETEEEAEYRELTLDEIKELAAEGATRSAKIVTESHLSLAGATGKVGLYYDEASDHWYQPSGTAPSTHIVKQSHVRLKEIVLNELLCLGTAANCGISVPECFVLDAGGKDDNEVLLASKRYDRIFNKDNRKVGFLPCPFRLHQEDFAQALGIASRDKYEPENGNYLRLMFDLLRRYSSDPVTDRLRLWDVTVFNCLIGNTDNHLKNSSLLYSPSLAGIRLAPAYDLLSTTVYEGTTRRLSMRVGNAKDLDGIAESSFQNAASELGLVEKAAMERYEELCGRFEAALSEETRKLRDEGFSGAEALRDKILLTGGYRRICG